MDFQKFNKSNLKKNGGEKMKKIALGILIGLFVLVGSINAHAFNLGIGEWNAHFSNFSSIYDSAGNPQQAGYTPQQGDYLKSVITLDSIIPKGGGVPVWVPTTTEQIAGFEYGFEFLGMTGGATSAVTYWGPVTETQSRLDLYLRDPYVWNTGPGFAPQTGPVNSGPGHPGIVAGINEPASSYLFLGGNVLQHPDQTFAGSTLVMAGNLLTGTGSGDFYVDADSGWFDPFLLQQNLGPAGLLCDMYLKFSYNTNAPLYGWTVRSEDPADFGTKAIPEPGTLLLLGSGLLGLARVGRKKFKI